MFCSLKDECKTIAKNWNSSLKHLMHFNLQAYQRKKGNASYIVLLLEVALQG